MSEYGNGLVKIRLLLKKREQNSELNQFENQYSIEETIITNKRTYDDNSRQYIRNKPHKLGFKFSVRAGVSGYIKAVPPQMY